MKKYYKIESTSGYVPYFVEYVETDKDVVTTAHGFKKTLIAGSDSEKKGAQK